MNNYSQYTTWQEVGGKLSPVCEKPDVRDYENVFGNNLQGKYQKDLLYYQDKIKNPPRLTVIGDINTIKGRKDLKIDVDFRLQKQWLREKENEWLDLDENIGININCKTRVVAVLINTQKETDKLSVINIIKKYLGFQGKTDDKSWLQASVQYYLESGNISGSFLEAIQKIITQANKQLQIENNELNKVKLLDDKIIYELTAEKMDREKDAISFLEWGTKSYTSVESKELNKSAWVNYHEHEILVNGSDYHYTKLIKDHGKTTKELYVLYSQSKIKP